MSDRPDDVPVALSRAPVGATQGPAEIDIRVQTLDSRSHKRDGTLRPPPQ
jgi:hypothetical protein